jgi:hypothetical protein
MIAFIDDDVEKIMAHYNQTNQQTKNDAQVFFYHQ